MPAQIKNNGFTIIEVMIVVAIIAVLTAIFITNLIGYRDKTYCTGVEHDAGNILSALSCYFSEPDNNSCMNINSLINDKNCGFSLNPENEADIRQNGSDKGVYWTIMVTDGSARCPRGDVFTTYMGTVATPKWIEAPP